MAKDPTLGPFFMPMIHTQQHGGNMRKFLTLAFVTMCAIGLAFATASPADAGGKGWKGGKSPGGNIKVKVPVNVKVAPKINVSPKITNVNKLSNWQKQSQTAYSSAYSNSYAKGGSSYVNVSMKSSMDSMMIMAAPMLMMAFQPSQTQSRPCETLYVHQHDMTMRCYPPAKVHHHPVPAPRLK